MLHPRDRRVARARTTADLSRRLRLVIAAVVAVAAAVAAALWVPAPAAAGQYIVALQAGGGAAFQRDVARSRHVRGLQRVRGASRLVTVEIPGDDPGVIRAVRRHPGVAYVEKDLIRRFSWTPNDPLTTGSPRATSRQWHLPRIRANTAWNKAATGYTGQGAVIAVLDTGVDSSHPDLRGKVMQGANVAAPRGSGRFVRRHTEDIVGHGTHVAGIAAATAGNRTGGAGVAPQALIMPVRVDSDSFEGIRASDIAAGIRYATNNGADVINLSLGGEGMTRTEARALIYAARRDVVSVCAAGNSGEGHVEYPARHKACVAVGASNPRDRKAGFSNYGRGLDLLAPGVSVLSTVPKNGGYRRWDGTSMATPVVAGAAAILKARGLSRKRVVQVLRRTARDVGRRGWDRKSGYGRVDVLAAVNAAGNKSYSSNGRPRCPHEGAMPPVPINSSGTTGVPLVCIDPQEQDAITYLPQGASPNADGSTFAMDADASYTGVLNFTPGAGVNWTEQPVRATDGTATSPTWVTLLARPSPAIGISYARRSVRRQVRRKFRGKRVAFDYDVCRRITASRARCQVDFFVGSTFITGWSFVENRRGKNGVSLVHVFQGERVNFNCYFRGGANCFGKVAFR